MLQLPLSIRWENERLTLLDQRLLPERIAYESPASIAAVADAIRSMKVRGAPAIGLCAAYGLVQSMQPHRKSGERDFRHVLNNNAQQLVSARPTAVNLRWAIDQLLRAADAGWREGDATAERVYQRLRAEAERIHDEDRTQCRRIGEHGLPLIRPGSGILTHCNAGTLAVSALGTVTAPLYLAHERGTPFRVFADETRPVLQGARLTAWELQQAGIDVTLICDNSAAQLMAGGAVDLVLVGTDRVTANGDVVNKIGTLGLAILCRHFGVPFYVACPSSTFDTNTPDGTLVTIEERDADEVTTIQGQRIAPEGIKVRNPAFDVTPHALVTAFITDKGVLEPPFSETLQLLPS